MRPYGGFEHNLQSLRVVEELEERYLAFPGLNLTFETREGILKHCSKANALKLGDIGERFLTRHQPGLEAQLSNLADEIAYNNHDVDDGLRAGLLDVGELEHVALFHDHYRPMRKKRARMSPRVLVHEAVRQMINQVVTDLIENSAASIEEAAPADIEAVRARRKPLIGFSAGIGKEHAELKQFLGERLYRHPRVLAMTERARGIVTGLFERYLQDPRAMPAEHSAAASRMKKADQGVGRARAVADYVAGMTDRYAISAYRRLVDATLEW
jgi:dGTPase